MHLVYNIKQVKHETVNSLFPNSDKFRLRSCIYLEVPTKFIETLALGYTCYRVHIHHVVIQAVGLLPWLSNFPHVSICCLDTRAPKEISYGYTLDGSCQN